jgi:hypothetical protein
MKHIREFDDLEIRDLMGDLGKVGHEILKGWCITICHGETGYLSIYAILAHNEGEVEKMIREDWKWVPVNAMPEKIGDAYKGRSNLFNNFLDALMSNLMNTEDVLFYSIQKDLGVKGAAGKNPMIIEFPGNNPILAAEKLESIFINCREKFSEEKDYFEIESSETTFPDLNR